MKTVFVIILTLFCSLCSINCLGSSLQDEKTNFENKSIKGITKLVYAYMEDHEATLEQFDQKTLSDAELKGMEFYRTKFIGNYENNYLPPTILDSINAFLSNRENGWSANGYDIFKTLRKNYFAQLDSENYNINEVFNVGDKTKITIKTNDNFHWNKTLSIIIGNNEAIESVIDQNQDSLLTDKDSRKPTINSSLDLNRSKNESNKLYTYIGFVLFFVLGFISAILYFNHRIKKLLNVEFSHYKKIYKEQSGKLVLFNFGVLEVLKNNKDFYKSRAKHEPRKEPNPIPSRNQFDVESNTQSKNPVEHNEVSNSINPIPDSSPGIYVPEAINTEKKICVLYFKAPESDGSFFEENASNSPTSRSYYKVKYIEGESAGELFYRSGNLDASALSQMDFILAPACDIENSSVTNPTYINIEANGSVIKEDNNWKIVKKIKIKLS